MAEVPTDIVDAVAEGGADGLSDAPVRAIDSAPKADTDAGAPGSHPILNTPGPCEYFNTPGEAGIEMPSDLHDAQIFYVRRGPSEECGVDGLTPICGEAVHTYVAINGGSVAYKDMEHPGLQRMAGGEGTYGKIQTDGPDTCGNWDPSAPLNLPGGLTSFVHTPGPDGVEVVFSEEHFDDGTVWTLVESHDGTVVVKDPAGNVVAQVDPGEQAQIQILTPGKEFKLGGIYPVENSPAGREGGLQAGVEEDSGPREAGGGCGVASGAPGTALAAAVTLLGISAALKRRSQQRQALAEGETEGSGSLARMPVPHLRSSQSPVTPQGAMLMVRRTVQRVRFPHPESQRRPAGSDWQHPRGVPPKGGSRKF